MISHHRKMFEDIWKFRNIPLDSFKLDRMDSSYREKLSLELGSEMCKAWIIKQADLPVASGAISLSSMVPTPDDPSFHIAYVHSIFTENDCRKKGLADRIIKEIVEYCESRRIGCIILHSSEAGWSVYLNNGFIVSNNVMSLNLSV